MDSKPFTSLKREPAFNMRVQDILVNNSAFLRESHEHFPSGLSHDYFMWGINPENEYRNLFLEVSSMYNIAVFLAFIAESVLDNEHWEAYKNGIAQWARNAAAEAYTDNMAFHYHTNKKDNPSFYEKQYKIMSQFYEASIAKIDGVKTTASELLKPIRKDFTGFPFYQLHVNPNRSTRLMEQFLLESGTNYTIDNLNEDGWSLCVANINFVEQALNDLDNHYLLPYLRDRYRLRHEGQKVLLNGLAITREDILDARAPEIMVSYTLAYFIAATSTAYKLDRPLEAAYQNNLLQPVLNAADVLVRITNDLGPIASASPKTIEAIFDSLLSYHHKNITTTQTMTTLLEEWSDNTEILPFFAIRLKKDLTMGEDNIARDYRTMHGSYTIYEQLAFMRESIIHYAQVYQSIRENFDADLTHLTKALGSPIYSQLAKRFVIFHEQIYGNNYKGLSGDYAV